MIRVLVVDDSAFVRAVLRSVLEKESDICVVGEAPDPYVARELVASQHPDVVTLDLEMPRMDGLTFLRKLMEHHPLPVVVVSSLTPRGSRLAVEAFAAGAVEVLAKPSGPSQVGALTLDLVDAVRSAASSRVCSTSPPPSPVLPRLTHRLDAVLAMGASTGGTVALETILTRFPENGPSVVVTQHMPPGITAAFCERLNNLCAIEVLEATDGAELRPGLVLIAPGGKHLIVRAIGGRLVAEVREGPRVSGHCPSVDVLFRSVALAAGSASVGVILTGMGRDGARGLLDMRTAGAATFAQDADSCVVYGMPGAAVEVGAVEETVHLPQLAERLMRHFSTTARGRPAVLALGR